MSILIACIGNIFQGDDAFGCEVAKVLAARSIARDVRVVDYGIRGLDLAYALMDGPELTILVDVVSRGYSPGTLYTIEPDVDNLEDLEPSQLDAHSMDPLQVLRSAKAMGGKLGRILLVGCEPGHLGGEQGHMGLTPPVSASIQEAADMVECLVAKELQEVAQ